MLIPDGEFRYEIRRAGELIATEEESLAAGKIRGVKHPASGSNVYEVEAELDPDALIRRIVVRYSRGPFVRNATYESADGAVAMDRANRRNRRKHSGRSDQQADLPAARQRSSCLDLRAADGRLRRNNDRRFGMRTAPPRRARTRHDTDLAHAR